VDVGHAKRIYPLLVTLDDLGGTLLMSRFLQGYFRAFLETGSSKTEKARPLFCTDVESLELVLPFLDSYPVSGFLQHWLDADPSLMSTLLAHIPEGLPTRKGILYDEWERLSNQFESTLFPSEHAAKSTI
jgi:hypothetical protein